MHTKDRLAAALRADGFHDLANKAAEGGFDDFLSELARPKTVLVMTLRNMGSIKAEALAARVVRGEFDNTAAEAAQAQAHGDTQSVKRHIYTTDGEH